MGRPKACGEVVNNIFIFAALVLFLPWLVEAQQQQRSVLNQHESSPEVVNSEFARTPLEATKIKTIETPLNIPRRKNTLSVNAKIHDQVDASADPALLAPSHPAKSGSLQSSGWGSSQPSARDLQDWEVEDFVLLATVDGSVWARDRKTGKQKWRLNLPDVSMISTKHHRRNRSSALDEGYKSSWTIDDYVWIVEPTEHGGLWIYRPDVPNGGLVNTGLTMKKLVDDMSPYQSDDPEVVYTGSRKTQMVHIDATNGRVLQVFGGDYVVETTDESCSPNDNFMGKSQEECQNPTLWLGLSKYEVKIEDVKSHRPIATLNYNEWGPNVQDAKKYGDKYHETLDSKYILSGQDGHVMGFDRERSRDHELLFQQKLPSPVVRVFDVFRPWGTEEKNPKLMMLPQPRPQTTAEDELDQNRNSRVVINLSADGSLYAMSGKSYPLAVTGSQAQCYQRGLWKQESWQNLDQPDLAEALTGIHCIDAQSENRLTISGPIFDDNQSKPSVPDLVPELVTEPSIIQNFQQIPKLAIDSVVEFVKNPVLLLFLVIFIFSYQRQIRASIGRYASKKKSILVREHRSMSEGTPTIEKVDDATNEIITEDIPRLVKTSEDEVAGHVRHDDVMEEQEPEPRKFVAAAPVEDVAINELGTSPEIGQEPGEAATPSPEKKKERKRGRRGGVKHKKTGNRGSTSDGDKDTPGKVPMQKQPPTVEDAVRDAQNMFPQKKLEPDIQTVSNDPAEVSGPIIRIGALEVDQDKLVGTGSNGTMVFEGKFDGRAVAVKRMLIQFYDIASQETKLLRESDDHPNVIRYFAQQQAAGFLYIALELCPASLADVIEKPQLHRELARGGEKDLPNVLYQIANGLQHLHNLRIVHRDLKPQNILVAMGKNGRPRLLVSDFGLCKKLEGEQSSFRATTAHAAGTSGWRAPELLLDDDIKQGTAMVDTSTDGGGSGSILVSSDVMPNRRATRAIDIFSLGLVFFYVLTKGSHPFDCGDRYMREVNIRKDIFNLSNLEVLGDYAYEAKDLVASMLAKEPKARPVAQQVMAHPFFWPAKKRLNFLCDVSDHFEKEKRDPPTPALQELEKWAPDVCQGDFLKPLGREFVDSMGKQRKYTGTRLLDLLRALRNKKNHYEDMPDKLKKEVGPLPDGYLSFWTRKFPNLLIVCWNIVYEVQWDEIDRFKEYYEPAGL